MDYTKVASSRIKNSIKAPQVKKASKTAKPVRLEYPTLKSGGLIKAAGNRLKLKAKISKAKNKVRPVGPIDTLSDKRKPKGGGHSGSPGRPTEPWPVKSGDKKRNPVRPPTSLTSARGTKWYK